VLVSLASATFVSLIATSVTADGECFKGFRDTTPAERAALTKVLETARRSLPPALDGWVVNSDDDLYVTPRICRDDEAEPWTSEFSRSYLRVDDREARDQILEDAGDRMKAAMAVAQPRMDAIMARIQELSMAAVAAAEKSDFDKVEKINAEIEKASAEMGQLTSGTYQDLDRANEDASRDRDIRIEVEVNSGHGLFGYGAEKTTVPAGADSAYRWRHTEGSVIEETVLVLFGPWRANGEVLEPVFRANAAPTAAQAVSVSITADESRIGSVLDSIDFKTLAASVSR
jgi:hypothetical protein